MNKAAFRSLMVLAGVALLCSILVSVATTTLRPIHERNELLQRYRNVVSLTGLVGDDSDDAAVFEAVELLDARVVDLSSGEFRPDIDPVAVNSRSALNDPDTSTAIPADKDLARLGRRTDYEVVYLVWHDQTFSRIILPINGQGMWSTLYGYIAIEADLETIAAVTFYEQAETAGLGDQIEDPDWQAQWQGRSLYSDAGDLLFQVASGPVNLSSPSAAYQVDGLTGATITAAGVTNLVRYWFGSHGYGPLLAQMKESPPER